MNVPAIAKKTFLRLQNHPDFAAIVNFVTTKLKSTKGKIERARFVHQLVDEYNEEVFDHPLVKKLSPCKQGCTACCHTQVSVTEDEAYLLATRVKAGIEIDSDRLKIQMQARDSSELFYNLSYEQRQCVFLSDQGSCQVYEDRPSVCRTNAVLGDASQCDTRETQKPLVLVLTENADVTIYAHFRHSKNNGSLPHLLAQQLKLINPKG